MTPPQPCIDSIVSNDYVLFAGSGLSARAGVPTWSECLFHLLDYAVQLSIIDDTYACTADMPSNPRRNSSSSGLRTGFNTSAMGRL